ncbi:WD repeat-containing protein 35 [Ischnura elegans]|uniref:WD repeat-containing protein 35 n=1 Tax=Ischnura elegans TaxID=197161 RepID=UPI001ED88D2A|nr:WD repeat-containing protein 35 [Ischnura elegans]
MFIYLSKKIAIPNSTQINCIAWNKECGFIACGGEDGMLKVLKLDSGKDSKVKGLAAPSNLSMNQTLEGHSGQIQVVAWNEHHQKLTSSDQNGLIIVWMLYKGAWYEEMINNRNKSVVKGMAWNFDGQKICIVYEDGAVIVGSVDGNRIWGKDVKGKPLSGVEWSPDGKILLFSVVGGEVHAYDSQGNFLMKLNLGSNSGTYRPSSSVVGLQWYNGRYGYIEANSPCLAILFDSGHLQIMRNENDDAPVFIDCGIKAVCCQWNQDGSVIAVAGSMPSNQPDTKETNVVLFYSPLGECLRTLKMPGRQISALAWDGFGSLRLAFAIDSHIYFANVRPRYKWCYLATTLVYAHHCPPRNTTAEGTNCNQEPVTGNTVTFWETTSNELYTKTVNFLYAMASSGEHCVLATQEEDSLGVNAREEDSKGKYGLILCNAIGTPVDTKYINVEPFWISMNNSYVFAASKDRFLLWRYRTPKSRSTVEVSAAMLNEKKDKIYHVDDTPIGVPNPVWHFDQSVKQGTSDPICCLASSDQLLVIGRESGQLQRYSLHPSLALLGTHMAVAKPNQMAINSDSTRLSVIDMNGMLTLVDLTSSGEEQSLVSSFERRDVWDARWASDNPLQLAAMEKTRMYIFRDLDPEEPILSSGYICSFRDLEIRAALLDEIITSSLMSSDEHPSVSEHILDLEVKSLRDTRDLLSKVGIGEASTFIEENPHPRLWRLLGEAALKTLDLERAEEAFVRCRDYGSIKFAKRLASVQGETLKRAEVAAYLKDFDMAEQLYIEADRRDLALSLREKLGDWQAALQLMQAGGSGGHIEDWRREQACNEAGDLLAVSGEWSRAKEMYIKGGDVERLARSLHALEEWEELSALAKSFSPGHPMLMELGQMFASVGMCAEAVDAYLKCGQKKAAMNVCVSLNEWSMAVNLAREHNISEDVPGLLSKYIEHLLEEKKTFQAIELYCKAECFLEAAKIMFQIAKDEDKSLVKKKKKFYVLAAHLVERHLNALNEKSLLKEKENGENQSEKMLLTGSDLIMDYPWKGAEAYHYLMLAQRQLYEGDMESALKTSLLLKEYEDLLNVETVYSLIALTSCGCEAYEICSQAFIKLEALSNISDEQQEKYEELALEIFMKHSPKDNKSKYVDCHNCGSRMSERFSFCPSCKERFGACIASGRPLFLSASHWTCSVCHHRAFQQEMTSRASCPLCYSSVLAEA